MKNYWLEHLIEKEDLDLPWDPTRIRSLKSLIKPAAQFSVDLDRHVGPLSLLDYGFILQDHRDGSCDQDKITSWVYAGLLRKAVQDTNAIAILRSKSLWSQAPNLWRSLFETEVVCHYIEVRSSDDHLACRYMIHSMLRKTFRQWEEFNETCRRLGKENEYSAEEIRLRKDLYQKEFGEKWGDCAWTHKPKHSTFERIAQPPTLTRSSTALRAMKFTQPLEKT